MKRLLIAGFLLIISMAVLAVTASNTRKNDCPRETGVCGTRKCEQSPAMERDRQQFFWEPVSRMMIAL
ncbi:MAG: hypothetical protein K0Q66_786 [Chitinophagaceae bacterium]|jgi:hypothetical protein|nr:hypothetical protein [Chitinophagaceae bacterium]